MNKQIFAITVLLLFSSVFAFDLSQQIKVNGTLDMITNYQDENVLQVQQIDVNGTAYIQLSYRNGDQRLVELEEYMKELEAYTKELSNYTGSLGNYVTNNQGKWSRDHGITMDDVLDDLQGASEIGTGENSRPSEQEKAFFAYIYTISQAQTNDLLNNGLGHTLDSHTDSINQLTYLTEAMNILLERTYPDSFCQAKREVIEKYNITSVKCGLHSKDCYNGNLVDTEDGRDYCVERVSNPQDTCYGTYAKCGHIEEFEIYPGEEGSYSKVLLTYDNKFSDMELDPTINIEIYKIDDSVKNFTETFHVDANSKQTYEFYIENNMSEGIYRAELMVRSGIKEIYDKDEYYVYQPYSLQRDVSLSGITKTNETFKVIATNKNYPMDVTLEAGLFKGNQTVDTQEKTMYVKDKQIYDFDFDLSSGEYTLVIREKTGASQTSLDFKQEAVYDKITGNILSFTAAPGSAELGVLLIMLGLLYMVFSDKYSIRMTHHKKKKFKVMKLR